MGKNAIKTGSPDSKSLCFHLRKSLPALVGLLFFSSGMFAGTTVWKVGTELADSRAIPSDTVLAEEQKSEKAPLIETGSVVEIPEVPAEKQFEKGFHIEPWMFGAGQWVKMEKEKRPALNEYKLFQNHVAGIKEHGGNIVYLWPPKTIEFSRGPGTYEADVLWPSRYYKHSLEWNALEEIVKAFQKEGIHIQTRLRTNYPKKLEEFPETETRDKPAPYINRYTREYMKGIVLEQVQAGVDGVHIGYDEQYATAIRYPASADEFTKKVFEERYNLPFPEEPADTESFRKWLVFAYEEFASYLAEASAAAKKANPEVLTATAITALDTAWNARQDWGVARDVVGHTVDIDHYNTSGYLSFEDIVHWKTAAQTKEAIAAHRKRSVFCTHNCPWAQNPEKQPGFYLHFPPVYMYGPPISHIMHGGKRTMYWRYNFMFAGGYNEYVKQAFSILDTLAAWGAKDARTPVSIAVLRSRASEDWWQVRQRYNEEGVPMDQTRGFIYHKWLEEFLFTGAYPFDMYQMDYPEDFEKKLSAYDLIILPFPYSISREAFKVIEKSVEQGKPVIVFDRKGETDEWGNFYDKPLFDDLVGTGKVIFIDDDIPVVGHHSSFILSMRARIDGLLGDKKQVYFNPFGNDVELAVLENSKGEYILAFINWTDRNIEVEAGLLRLPEEGRKFLRRVPQNYRVLQRDLKEIRKVVFGGKEVLSSGDLKRFRVPLARWDVKVLYVSQAVKQP
jgi:hypothetical protein